MRLRSILVCLTLLAWLGQARCAEPLALARAVQAAAAGVCRSAATAAETALHVPDAFLSAIAKVESGRPNPATGTLAPWPWTVNAEGAGSFYATKAEAMTAVRTLQARGVRSIDVGCLQVNLLHHPDAFASLDQAFDPAANAMYAGGFLVALFHRTGSWPLAAAAYHSQTPTIGAPYERRVLAEWATPDPDGNAAGARPAAARQETARRPAQDIGAPAALAAPQGVAASAPVGRAPIMGETVFAGTHGVGQTGRSLAAYRLMPTRLALRAGRPGY